MAEICLNKYFLISFVLLLQIEFFYFLCYDYAYSFLKFFKIDKLTTSINTNTFNSYNILLFSYFFFALLFTKNFYNFTFLSLIFTVFFLLITFIVLTNYINKTKNNKNVMIYIIPLFGIFLIFFCYIESFLSFFFLIEIYGVLYYFVFLTNHQLTNQTLLKYKNNLLLLLWNNFLTTMFLALSCYFFFKFFATTSFFELSYLTSKTNIVYLFIFGLFWKMGLPLFHFFKLEIYKYLLNENIFLFSILTALINIFIFFFCFNLDIVFSSIYSYNFIVILLVFFLNMLIFNLKLQSFLLFFAFSGIITLATLLTLFII